jgi:hypothetical protein
MDAAPRVSARRATAERTDQPSSRYLSGVGAACSARLSKDEADERLVEIEKGQQSAGHFPDDDATMPSAGSTESIQTTRGCTSAWITKR